MNGFGFILCFSKNSIIALFNSFTELKQSDFTKYLLHYAPVSSLQKLGYILEFVCGKIKLADALFSEMKRDSLKLFRIKLSPSGKVKGFSSLNRWKVIVNTKIETDE